MALKARGFTSEELYAIVAPRRTLARRKERGEDLTSPNPIGFCASIIFPAWPTVFSETTKRRNAGSEERSRVLNEVPLVLLQSETGARLVEEELHRIDYGIYV